MCVPRHIAFQLQTGKESYQFMAPGDLMRSSFDGCSMPQLQPGAATKSEEWVASI